MPLYDHAQEREAVWPPVGESHWADGVVDEVEAERHRLQAAIADAKQRALVARERSASTEPHVRDVLRAELEASSAQLAALEADTEAKIASVRAAADAEAARIIAEARERVTLSADGTSNADSPQVPRVE